jgi:SanA protein
MSRKWRVFYVLIIVIGLGILGIYQHIHNQSSGKIFHQVDPLPARYAAIVLGAGLRGGKPSMVLRDRLDIAASVYHRGKAQKILVTGDNRRVGHNEPRVMKDYLISKGVPADVIFMDAAGFDTYSSMYRAAHIFQINNAIVITQNFHLPRSIYLARKIGIDAVGISSDQRKYKYSRKYNLREYPACAKAYLNILLERKPRFHDGNIPISGPANDFL